MTTRRDVARPIIADVIKRIGVDDMPTLRKALRDAFPWGNLEYHPYKVWLDEVRVQLGTKRKKDSNQLELFNGYLENTRT